MSQFGHRCYEGNAGNANYIECCDNYEMSIYFSNGFIPF